MSEVNQSRTEVDEVPQRPALLRSDPLSIMPAAPSHPRERERLAALHSLSILDTDPEERYDRITRLVAAVFNVPMATISLVDEHRQWFKSRIGIKPRQTARNASFCAHAILSEQPLIVPDTLDDPRFNDNPLVMGEPCIRFYAGMPLRGPGGLNLGTLCLIDEKPRQFSEREEMMLKELAAMVEHEMGLRDAIAMQEALLRAQDALILNQEAQRQDLVAAARYVRSLLPDEIPEGGPVRADWEFLPSEQLGGDVFYYLWIDEHRFAVYLLDVAGHGTTAALLSVSLLDAVRSRAHRGAATLTNPAALLGSLNRDYPMAEHSNLFFSMWYGLVDLEKRQLTYSSAGHPPAILVPAGASEEGDLEECATKGQLVGVFPNSVYSNQRRILQPGDRLAIFSDGLYEAASHQGHRWRFSEFAPLLGQGMIDHPEHSAAQLTEMIRRRLHIDRFEDDVSLIVLSFD